MDLVLWLAQLYPCCWFRKGRISCFCQLELLDCSISCRNGYIRCFLVKSLVTAVGKASFHFAQKSGCHTWNATRKWIGKKGFAPEGQPVHHWLITQKMIKKHPRLLSVANQPWNLTPMKNRTFHNSVHGIGSQSFGMGRRFLYGIPGYFQLSIFGALYSFDRF